MTAHNVFTWLALKLTDIIFGSALDLAEEGFDDIKSSWKVRMNNWRKRLSNWRKRMRLWNKLFQSCTWQRIASKTTVESGILHRSDKFALDLYFGGNATIIVTTIRIINLSYLVSISSRKSKTCSTGLLAFSRGRNSMDWIIAMFINTSSNFVYLNSSMYMWCRFTHA